MLLEKNSETTNYIINMMAILTPKGKYSLLNNLLALWKQMGQYKTKKKLISWLNCYIYQPFFPLFTAGYNENHKTSWVQSNKLQLVIDQKDSLYIDMNAEYIRI